MKNFYIKNALLRIPVVFLLLTGVSVAQGKPGNHGSDDDTNIQATVLNQLSFGTLIVGRDVQSTVGFSDQTAGSAVITGLSRSQTVTLMFSLPQDLYSGANQLSIGFSSNSAAWSTSNDLSGATSFNPNSQITLPQSATSTGNLYLWIGATVHVSPQQATGQYQGTITVQVSVNNNDD